MPLLGLRCDAAAGVDGPRAERRLGLPSLPQNLQPRRASSGRCGAHERAASCGMTGTVSFSEAADACPHVVAQPEWSQILGIHDHGDACAYPDCIPFDTEAWIEAR